MLPRTNDAQFSADQTKDKKLSSWDQILELLDQPKLTDKDLKNTNDREIEQLIDKVTEFLSNIIADHKVLAKHEKVAISPLSYTSM